MALIDLVDKISSNNCNINHKKYNIGVFLSHFRVQSTVDFPTGVCL